MKSCKRCRDLLLPALYGELASEDKAFFEDHLASCPVCAAEFRAMTETLKTMSRRVRPEPGQEFWEGYWDRLVRRMEKEDTPAEASSPSAGRRLGRIFGLSPRWIFQAAAALVLVVLGIFIGRMVFSPRRVPVEIARQPVRTALDNPVVRARAYIDRSKPVLLALVNHDPASENPYALDLPSQKRISRELVNQAGALKSDLKEPGQRRLRELVGDLEIILLQIANLEAENDLEAVEFVKQGVESGGLLLKINLSEMNSEISGSGRKPAPEKSASQTTKI
ncbi:MAG: zf-HC2 domain-containing protein [Candidatus Aminicenantes bacterium]|nr:zf-HC2 domain-containing protein [Candidatus Aminicenantes bacterium]